jgi:hypothetical protein
MHLEMRARDLILTDAMDGQAFRRYLEKEMPTISRPTQALWKELGGIVTVATVEQAFAAGSVPPAWADPWGRMIREFVRDDITPEWVKNIALAGSEIAKKVNRLQLKAFDFDSTMRLVKAWVDEQGGKLIVDLTAAQMSTIHALLQAQIAIGVTSPYILAQRIKPLVGLTVREARAVSRFMATLTEEGYSASAITEKVGKYAKYLHRERANRIARTEISNSFNFGQITSVRQAVEDGWLPGVPEKSWLAGGPDPCEICQGNDEMGAIALEAAFPSGHDRPTAHPNCACSVSYTIRR